MEHVIEASGLTKRYRSQLGLAGRPALENLDLRVKQHQIYGFLGRNGAGKTTTIKILCGLIRATSGSAQVCGIDVRKRESRRHIGYLPENPYFYEYLTPKETLEFYGQLEGLTPAGRAKEWDKLSELLDLRDIADQRVRGFSKGMRQRLGFAVALVGDPDVLILDEPMSGLDPLQRRAIREIILLLRDEKKTVFFSSHVLGDVEQICDRVAILGGGRLVVEGRVDELLRQIIKKVEVIAQGLDTEAAAKLGARAVSQRESEDGRHFVYPNEEEANEAVQGIVSLGGRLVAYTPIKESLEDYFMRLQEQPA